MDLTLFKIHFGLLTLTSKGSRAAARTNRTPRASRYVVPRVVRGMMRDPFRQVMCDVGSRKLRSPSMVGWP